MTKPHWEIYPRSHKISGLYSPQIQICCMPSQVSSLLDSVSSQKAWHVTASVKLKTQQPLLSMVSWAHYPHWYLNTVFLLIFICIWLDQMECPLVKYHNLSITGKGPMLSISTHHSCLTRTVASSSWKSLKLFDFKQPWQANEVATVKRYHTLQSKWTSRATYTERRKPCRLWGSSDTFI